MAEQWSSVKLKVTEEVGRDRTVTETVREGLAARDWIWRSYPATKVDKAGRKLVILKIDGGFLQDWAALAALAALYARKNPGRRVVLSYEIDGKGPPPPVAAVAPKAAVQRERENTVQPPLPTYEIVLQLGDVDALFEPFDASSAHPHLERGVQQRLQALGYFYTPLGHPDRDAHAEKCWAYYRRVHEQASGALADSALLGKLVDEIRGNVVTATLPGSGEILAPSQLPGPNDFGALRFPGGYGTTKHRVGIWRSPGPPDAAGDPFDFPIGSQRRRIEDKLREHNDRIGKIPLVATVTRVFPDRREPADGERVYFQLLPPQPLPGTSPLAAPPLRATVMDYAKDDEALTKWLPTRPVTVAAKYRTPFPDPAAPAPGTGGPPAVGAGGAPPPPLGAGGAPPPPLRPGGAPPPPLGLGGAPPPPGPRAPGVPALGGGPVNLGNANVDWFAAKVVASEAAKGGARAATVEAQETDRRALAYGVVERTPDRGNEALEAVRSPYDAAHEAEKKAFLWGCEQHLAGGQHSAEMKAAVRFIVDQILFKRDLNNVGRRDVARTYDPATTFQGRGDIEGVYFNDCMFEISRSAPDLLMQAPTPAPPFEMTGSGPEKLVRETLDRVAGQRDADDPQRYNAPHDCGGAAGVPVAGAVFETASRARFNDGHAPFGALPVAAAAAVVGDRHKHAVACQTNDAGHAGVVFMPSSCGGDTYRLRAYVEPPGKRPEEAVSAETGTLVVWRNLRIARYLRQAPVPGALPARVREIFEQAPNGGANDEGGTYKTAPVPPDWLATATAYSFLASAPPVLAVKQGDPLEPVFRRSDLLDRKQRYRSIDHQFVSVSENFRRCYCEVLCDYAAPERITQDMLDRARRDMITALGNRAALRKDGAAPPEPLRVDWDELVFCDEMSPYLLNVRHYAVYNARLDAARDERAAALAAREAARDLRRESEPGAWGTIAEESYDDMQQAHWAEASPPHRLGKKDAENITAAVFMHGVQPIAESLMDGGVSPGFTIVQFPHGDTWDHRNLDLGGMFTSGWAFSPRGAFVFYTDALHRHFMCYAGTANVVHELGHALALPHQPPEPISGDAVPHQDPVPRPNQTPTVDQVNCVMSYRGSYGELCGRCVLALRGWKVAVTTWTDPDNAIGATGRTDGL